MKESTLILDNISKSFARTDTNTITHALDNINFTVREGEFVSIVGPSGCGKSTILRLIAGLIVPTAGEIRLNNEKIEGTNPDRGMVFQKPTLFPWLTVEENVAYSLKVQNKLESGKEEVDRLISKVGLSEFKNSYPHQLSGGMAQRVSLIRSMINKPRVFLLDEPLGALDAFTRMDMQDELLGMWRENKHIMIMVTHDVDEAIYMSTRVIVMAPRPGRIRKSIDIDLDYPRNRLSNDFVDYRKEIMEMLDFGKIEK
ncbi:aliphatic sulfonates ABC transporter ATP-binding protein SsuB [Gottschalkia acidurici 9a]|uniref:Aliphatic sulfonates ABC transporter ATP-binding protein SsuB n=1 Tax=Gottschalkia acidurici (strain ATCC 7906 / DSM 604 / BCRC 14475 / CIP 104303 / KCTC 5404 / NCIMB 10678 / 9a) TaxID=1128398 RepID=K0B1N0_GOTA9|nr:ABC transporter ATP-binding protein [Gottschalkia acidurici]AFS79002.1 aliphatic sulfonates ABC transporter ATP-binding protein SsuB [Gottschalkia acidurici 9a]